MERAGGAAGRMAQPAVACARTSSPVNARRTLDVHPSAVRPSVRLPVVVVAVFPARPGSARPGTRTADDRRWRTAEPGDVTGIRRVSE